MKLRYFYLLCFLVSIDWSFCYEYITNDKAMRQSGSVKRNTKSKHGKQKNLHRRTRRQEYEEEKDPVASIDIASFIQQPDPDYEAVEDQPEYKNKRRSSKYYDDFNSLNELQKSLENNDNQPNDLEDSNNMAYNEKWPDLDRKSKSYAENILDVDALTRKENSAKISKRRQAIPFFSREDKEKKHKKRKLFNFGFRSTSMTTILPKLVGLGPPDLLQLKKVFKRSNFDRYCPLCKRKILPKMKKAKQELQKNLHNSRQHYQNLGDITQTKEKKAVSNNDLVNSKSRRIAGMYERADRGKRDSVDRPEEYDIKESRHSKRDDTPEETKTRQLKELEIVQRKVDSLEINYPRTYTPKMEKPTT